MRTMTSTDIIMYIDIQGSQYQYVMINIPATALWYCTRSICHCLPAVYLSSNALGYVPFNYIRGIRVSVSKRYAHTILTGNDG